MGGRGGGWGRPGGTLYTVITRMILHVFNMDWQGPRGVGVVGGKCGEGVGGRGVGGGL